MNNQKQWHQVSGVLQFQIDLETLALEEIKLNLDSLKELQIKEIKIEVLSSQDAEDIDYPADRSYTLGFTVKVFETSDQIKEIMNEKLRIFALDQLILLPLEKKEGNLMNDHQIALGVGYAYAIVPKDEIDESIQLRNTGKIISHEDFTGPLYKGTTYEDSRKIDEILDRYENFRL